MKEGLDTRYFSEFSTLFSTSFLNKIISGDHQKSISWFSDLAGLKHKENTSSLQQLIEIYNFLLTNYRCEYIYKSIIFKNFFWDRHDFNDATVLTEFFVGNSRADFIILNGTSTVYEIKSDLDNFDRLESQLKSYNKVFDHIYVVTFVENTNKILNMLPFNVGLIILGDDNTLKEVKKSKSNKKYTDPSSIFDTLRHEEYKKIILSHFGYVPNVPNTQRYARCKEMFEKIPSTVAHKEMVKALSQRKINDSQQQLVYYVPDEIKMFFCNKFLSSSECEKIENNLLL